VLTHRDLASIDRRSRSLYERLDEAHRSGTREAEVATGDADLAAARLLRWRENCARGDPGELSRRLREDGLDEESVLRMLGGCAPSAGGPGGGEAPWCRFLADALQSAASWDEEEVFGPEPATEGLAYHALALPLSSHAERCMRARTADVVHLRPDCAKAVAGRLAARLCALAAPTYHLEFTLYRAQRESSLAGVLRRARGETSDQLFREFVRGFYAGGFRSFFLEYPVLARQLAVVSMHRIDAYVELAERLAADRDELDRHLAIAPEAGAVVAVELGLSDSHHGGRTTALLTFASGAKLIYKPKPLDTDLLFGRLIAWLNGRGIELPLRAVKTLSRSAYGWQEHVAPAACGDEDAARRFYRRTGELLALVYALEGYDCHHENLIAAGEFPCLVDTETIFNPYKEMETVAAERADAARLASETVYYSVLRTGMLPTWSIRRDGSKQDLSGFGGGAVAGNDPSAVVAWVAGDSDDVRVERAKRPLESRPNRPTLANGQAVSADDHTEEIRAGFAGTYRRLLEHRAELVRELRGWPPADVRFVRRATRHYCDLLRRLTRPEYLRDGLDWSIEVEVESRMLLAAGSPSADVWNLLREEYAALVQCDVPYFKVRTDSLDVCNSRGETVVARYFTADCTERLIDRLGKWSLDDLALQDRYVAYAFYARAARSLHDEPGGLDYLRHPEKASTAHLAAVEPDACREAAEAIGRELLDEALRAGDGSMSWIALEYLKEAGIFQLKPISYNLYSGAMGVTLFLAALSRATGRDEYRAAAKAALAPILRIAESEADDVIRFSGLGVGVGLGSLIYGLASVAELLDGDGDGARCCAAARACALGIGDEHLRQDRRPDLIFGTAGAVLAVAKLARWTRDRELAAQVGHLARHLLEARTETSGVRLVPTYGGAAVTGLSHGAAGVALSLTRAWELTGEQDLLDAAMDHVRFEEGLYDEGQGNYRDYRSRDDRPSFMTTWCHGAPGIGLCRLYMHHLTGDPELLPQIRRALATMSRFTLDHLDHLCCGNLGRLDVRLQHALLHGDGELLAEVRRDAAYVLERARRRGAFRMFLNAPAKVFSPGLFVGASGIGYTLLRLADPSSLPSVLAFE
jgi:class II lanthipeptide synthase